MEIKKIEWDKEKGAYIDAKTKQKITNIKPTGRLEKISCLSGTNDIPESKIEALAKQQTKKPTHYETTLAAKRVAYWQQDGPLPMDIYIIKFYTKKTKDLNKKTGEE